MWWDYEADMKRNARKEGLAKGRQEGIEAERREGIRILIRVSRQDGLTREDTAARLREHYALSETAIEKYLTEFWAEN